MLNQFCVLVFCCFRCVYRVLVLVIVFCHIFDMRGDGAG